MVTSIGNNDRLTDLAIQEDGKIIAVGSTGFVSSSKDFAIARYNINGNGTVITNLPGFVFANDVVIQPDGKIVIAGYSGNQPGRDFFVARYLPNGTLDNTFNSTGYVIIPLLGDDYANAVALQSDGKIVAAGTSNLDFAVVRYNTNGSLDTSFDTDGIVTTEIAGGDYINDVIIQPDGKIIAAGGSGSDFSLARYDSNGSLDPTFDSDGKVLVDFGGFDYAFAAALQPDGKIVAAGYKYNIGMAVARFNPNGSLDTSFHGAGKLITVITGSLDWANAVAIQVVSTKF